MREWFKSILFAWKLAYGGIVLAIQGIQEMQEAEYEEELLNNHW